MPDHARMLAGIPPKIGVPGFMGCLKGKSPLPMSGRHANLKYKFGNRKFWAEGCHVPAAGLDEATIAKHVREQEQADIALDRPSARGHGDPSRRWPGTARLAGTPRARRPHGPERSEGQGPGPLAGFAGSCPKSRPPAVRVVMIRGPIRQDRSPCAPYRQAPCRSPSGYPCGCR